MATREATMREARAKARKARAEGEPGVDRRQRILYVAARRFAESGFEQTTVRQIADDVQILSGSLYHHFATKEDMLHAIVRGPVERLAARAAHIATLPGEPEARLVTLIRADLAALTGEHEAHAILYNERALFRRNPDFGYVIAAKKATRDAWEAILAAGIAAGQFDAGADPVLTISTVIRLLNTSADWFSREDGAVRSSMGAGDFARLADFHVAFVLRAVRAVTRAGAPIPAALE